MCYFSLKDNTRGRFVRDLTVAVRLLRIWSSHAVIAINSLVVDVDRNRSIGETTRLWDARRAATDRRVSSARRWLGRLRDARGRPCIARGRDGRRLWVDPVWHRRCGYRDVVLGLNDHRNIRGTSIWIGRVNRLGVKPRGTRPAPPVDYCSPRERLCLDLRISSRHRRLISSRISDCGHRDRTLSSFATVTSRCISPVSESVSWVTVPTRSWSLSSQLIPSRSRRFRTLLQWRFHLTPTQGRMQPRSIDSSRVVPSVRRSFTLPVIYKRYRRMPRGLTPGLNPIGRGTNH